MEYYDEELKANTTTITNKYKPLQIKDIVGNKNSTSANYHFDYHRFVYRINHRFLWTNCLCWFSSTPFSTIYD